MEGSPQTKLEEILGFAAEALGTAIEKKVADKVEDIKGKVLKRLRDEPDDYHPETSQYVSKETRAYRRTYARRGSNKAYVARIARSVLRKGSETKCFSQTLATSVAVTSSWAWYSALAGLTQGLGLLPGLVPRSLS